MSLPAFPLSATDPVLERVPAWPEWVSYEGDAPRIFWFTKFESRYYCISTLAGETDQMSSLGLTSYHVNYAGLQEMLPRKWGYAPFIVHEIFDGPEEMLEWVKQIKQDLQSVLLLNLL